MCSSRSPALLLCAALLVPVTAAASPAPVTRAHPAPDAPRAHAIAAARASAAGAAIDRAWECASDPDAGVAALQAHLDRVLADPLPTPNSRDVGGIAVLEDDGTFFYPDAQGHPLFDVTAASNAFFRTHGDDYDALAFYLASGQNTWLGSPGALAASFPLHNDTQGIGLVPFDFSASYGSAGRLGMVMSMNGLHRYWDDPYRDDGWGLNPLDVLGHEFGHRWLAYVYVDSAGTRSPGLLGRDYQHWNFFANVDSSLMDGCAWDEVAPDSFRTVGRYGHYFALDQYLMGLRAAAEVPPLFVVNDPHAYLPDAAYVIASSPIVGLGCRGRATWWSVDDVIAAEGPRVPDVTAAPKAFHIALALVVPRGTSATAADLAKLDTLRTRFVPWFETATDGRGAMDVSLISRAGHVAIAAPTLRDVEDAGAARAFTVHASLAGGALGRAIDPASVRLFWRPQGASAWNALPLPPAGGDAFAGTLPGPGVPGVIEYYAYAASDSAGIDASDPPGGASAPATFTIGPDATPPAIAHVPIAACAPAQLPRTLLARVTDNLGVDSVWVAWSVDGGPAQWTPASLAGADTFTVPLGAGLAIGQRLAYHFVARDAAGVPNVAGAGATPDTLTVGGGWIEDWENGAAGWTHASAGGNWRDEWRLSADGSLPAGGSGWHCGRDGGEGYPPHVDAVLVSPLLTTIAPGTVLRFDHHVDLETFDLTHAWDGARIEASVNGIGWSPLTPVAGYTHTMLTGTPIPSGSPCWSGLSAGVRSEALDLSALAPGPARVRFRMTADDFTGAGGWSIDHLRIDPPVGPAAGVDAGAPALTVRPPWPNPARDALHLALATPRAARAEWALFDLAGRRLATLWDGPLGAGAHELRAALPPLPPGLCFARLSLDGRVVARARVAVVR